MGDGDRRGWEDGRRGRARVLPELHAGGGEARDGCRTADGGSRRLIKKMEEERVREKIGLGGPHGPLASGDGSAHTAAERCRTECNKATRGNNEARASIWASKRNKRNEHAW